ncbi:hypothetical protein B0H17DRAFT_1141069 [Mycena rosella]|uniref:Uncharacterized protein n=1 Tax=Mycena rosella TaxID=1033263 RepID=A0AAD7D0F0_MYCRO|nr:hypothetical protein B0H17DRAFT_1141069 [Mycena rosella]
MSISKQGEMLGPILANNEPPNKKDFPPFPEGFPTEKADWKDGPRGRKQFQNIMRKRRRGEAPRGTGGEMWGYLETIDVSVGYDRGPRQTLSEKWRNAETAGEARHGSAPQAMPGRGQAGVRVGTRSDSTTSFSSLTADRVITPGCLQAHAGFIDVNQRRQQLLSPLLSLHVNKRINPLVSHDGAEDQQDYTLLSRIVQ